MVAKPDSLTANWLRIGTIGLAECIRVVVARSGWKQRYGKLPEGRGLGLACGAYMCGAGLSIYWNKLPHSGVQLLIDRSGQVTVFCGATEIGQGSDDVLAGIVAEVLGIDPYEVRCVTGDTGLTPIDLGSYSSRVTVMMGNAAIEAAGKLREMLAGAAAEALQTVPERIVLAQGRVFRADDPGKSLSFKEAVVMAEAKHGTLGAVGSYTPPKPPGRYKGGGVGPSPGVLVYGLRGGSRGRQDHRLDSRPEDLDCTRYRPRVEPGARAGPGRRLRVHGTVRGADGGADLPAPAAEALARARPSRAVDARVQEHHRARHARDGYGAGRGSRSQLPVRRQGSRAGPPAAGDAGGGQRDLRRDRRAHRRIADHSRQDIESAGAQGEGRRPARRAREFSRRALSGADDRPAAVGRRRRQRRGARQARRVNRKEAVTP